mmetsp:Transcript_14285/g.46915  ORF Transcript_14285/g.46915 Transcript_14285/m.46915 type:complete len:252 (+) Transcript_14285:448-1203(+)
MVWMMASGSSKLMPVVRLIISNVSSRAAESFSCFWSAPCAWACAKDCTITPAMAASRFCACTARSLASHAPASEVGSSSFCLFSMSTALSAVRSTLLALEAPSASPRPLASGRSICFAASAAASSSPDGRFLCLWCDFAAPPGHSASSAGRCCARRCSSHCAWRCWTDLSCSCACLVDSCFNRTAPRSIFWLEAWSSALSRSFEGVAIDLSILRFASQSCLRSVKEAFSSRTAASASRASCPLFPASASTV